MRLGRWVAGLAVVAGVGLAVACGGGGGSATPTQKPAPTSPPTSVPTAAPAATTASTSTSGGGAAEGQSLFADDCATCHGQNAAGGYTMGAATSADLRWASLGPMYNTDTTLVSRAILQGLDQDGKDLDPVMPRWNGDLTSAQVTSIIAYLQTLTTDAPANQPPAAPAGTSPGGQLFYQYCAVCHGTDGAGGKKIGTSNSADLRWAALSDTYNNDTTLISRAILTGKDQEDKDLDAEMPHWDGTLTADQVQQIIVFLQTLK